MSLWALRSLSINHGMKGNFWTAWLVAVSGLTVFTLPVAAQEVTCASTAPVKEILRASQQQEVVLAKEKALYVVMNLSQGMLELKARGILLKSFPFLISSWVGEPFTNVKVATLTRKIPLIEPEPTIPSIAKDDGSVSQAEAHPLVVTDMPHRYTVVWGEEFSLVIQSEKIDSAWDHVFEPTAKWVKRLTMRVSGWGVGIFGSSSRDLMLDLPPAKAQALYWALVSPMKMLIVPASCSGDSH